MSEADILKDWDDMDIDENGEIIIKEKVIVEPTINKDSLCIETKCPVIEKSPELVEIDKTNLCSPCITTTPNVIPEINKHVVITEIESNIDGTVKEFLKTKKCEV